MRFQTFVFWFYELHYCFRIRHAHAFHSRRPLMPLVTHAPIISTRSMMAHESLHCCTYYYKWCFFAGQQNCLTQLRVLLIFHDRSTKYLLFTWLTGYDTVPPPQQSFLHLVDWHYQNIAVSSPPPSLPPTLLHFSYGETAFPRCQA